MNNLLNLYLFLNKIYILILKKRIKKLVKNFFNLFEIFNKIYIELNFLISNSNIAIIFNNFK